MVQFFVKINNTTELLDINAFKISIDKIIILALEKNFRRQNQDIKKLIKYNGYNFIKQSYLIMDNKIFSYGLDQYINSNLLHNKHFDHSYKSGESYFTNNDINKIYNIIDDKITTQR